MTMRRSLPLLAIVLLTAAACNRGAAENESSRRRTALDPQPAPAAAQTAAPAAAPVTTSVASAGGVPTDLPRSVVLAGPAASHGDPASTILDASLFPDPRVREVYEKARLVADRLDKMYCYCHCHEEMGHRSLLSCFQGTHAAECGICLREGYQAWSDWQAGRSVEDSQKAADAVYHQGAPPPSLPASE
jgi:hypothetical protein